MAKAVWRLKKGMDRRFNSGHPWVYSNELMESPKGIEPGAPIVLNDAGGQFLALGYGNPNSLIAFRVLSRSKESLGIETPFSEQYLLKKLLSAYYFRNRQGLTAYSFRLCYGEGDFLPGLIIDRYKTRKGQVLVVQAHTAGAEQMMKIMPETLETFVKEISTADNEAVSWANTAVVFRNDINIRTMEGLESQPSRVVRPMSGENLEQIVISVRPGKGTGKAVEFTVDLKEGQKTGFFLDQAANIALAVEKISAMKFNGKLVKILDLCSYVGQWGTQLARVLKEKGLAVEVTAVDGSMPALKFAEENLAREGAIATLLKGDVMKDLESLDAKSYDIIICDPPALIKGRKDVPQGKHAYLQLNTQVFRLAKIGGVVVTCSCSGLLEEEEFFYAITKAARRNATEVQWIARGSQSPDHPMLLEFPEGRYLKSLIGIVAEAK